ncbi:MAG: hypothetical protein K0V04_27645 [Deltaproteobacteria bacterium]|nr:hypothetical protein [Deltaproteobacteria bacterium]
MAVMLAMACGDDTPVTAGGSGDGATTGSTTAEDESAQSTAGATDDGLDTTAGDTEDPPPTVDPIPDPPGLSANGWTNCEPDDDGNLTCWGAAACGVQGNGASQPTPPNDGTPGQTWASVAGGVLHTCAIDLDRALWCWGDGSGGQVGDGVLDDGLQQACRRTPVAIAEGATWARLSMGATHSCGVQMDGTLWCWGRNTYGQIGDGAVGPLYNRLSPTAVAGDTWIDVYAGGDHTCALDSEGGLWCWGNGGDGQLGIEGIDFSSTPVPVAGPPPLRELARGGASSTTCAVANDDSLWCWGENSDGAAGVGQFDEVPLPTEVFLNDPIDHVFAGPRTTCAVSNDGRLWCWGSGSDGQLGDRDTTLGNFSHTPVEITGHTWDHVVTGFRHVCGQTDEGQTLCWGANDAGQVGDGTSGPDNGRLEPTAVGSWGGGPVADDWATGSVGGTHSCGLRLDGSLWCWGRRTEGQLGNGDATEDCSPANPAGCSFTTPVATQPPTSGAWVEAVPGGLHTCARRDDGTLWCWGADNAGQLGHISFDGTVPFQVGAASDWTAIDLANATTCGIRAPGTL